MLGRKIDDGNGNEYKGVKMESRGKLGDDGKVKFVGPKKNVDRERKLVGLEIYVN